MLGGAGGGIAMATAPGQASPLSRARNKSDRDGFCVLTFIGIVEQARPIILMNLNSIPVCDGVRHNGGTECGMFRGACLTAFEELFWVVIETSCCRQFNDKVVAAGGLVHALSRRDRPSPIPGRPGLQGQLFPCHSLVAERSLACLTRIRGGPAWRLFRTDRGRPLCLPHSVVEALGAYCDLPPEGAVPSYLAPLDVLGEEERLWFVLDNWPRWSPQMTGSPHQTTTGHFRNERPHIQH